MPAPAAPAQSPPPARLPLWPAAALVLAIGAAYINSLHGAFVWDDLPSIVGNRAIEHWATALQRPAAVNTASGRPLVGLSLALNYALGGRSPLGYHLLNLLVHTAAALVLFDFVRGLALLPRWAGRYTAHATALAWGIAAVWSLHPLQTQAVTYVIQRAEALMGLCYLLTLDLFLRAEGSRHPNRWRASAVVACALGMTAKEVMVSAPVVVLLFDRTFFAGTFRRAWEAKKGFYGALFGTWLILFWLVFSLGGNRDGSTGGFSAHAAWGAYWLTQFPALATYLKLAFFPHPLVFQYGAFWLPNAAAALPGAAVVVPLALLTLVALVRWPEIGFFAFWFFSVLAVTSIVPGTVDMIAEYRMYLALAPLWILVAAALCAWRQPAAPWILGAAALALGVVTVARNRDYRSPASLWADNVAHRPDNALARYNLAVALLSKPGHEAEAQAQLEAAVRLNPLLGMAHYNLGLLLARQPNRAAEAIAQYEAAVRIAPRYSQAHNNLAVLLYRRGQLEPALRQFQLAVQSDAGNLAAWLNLVQVLEQLGRNDDALQAASALVRAHPGFAAGRAKLSLLRFDRGVSDLAAGHSLADAIGEFGEAVRLNPQFADAQFNLAASLERAGRRAEAIDHYRAAARLQPDVAEDHYRLARLLASEPGSHAEARAEDRKALALDPASAAAQSLLSELGGP